MLAREHACMYYYSNIKIIKLERPQNGDGRSGERERERETAYENEKKSIQ